MAVFRVERNTGYTVMSNHHLRNKELSLKAKGLLSQMLSLPEDWDYTLSGLSYINRESIDAIREAIKELERAGYIVRSRERDEKGKMTAIEYTIYEQPQPPGLDNPVLENPTADNPILENPTTDNPTSENPTQLNKDRSRTNLLRRCTAGVLPPSATFLKSVNIWDTPSTSRPESTSRTRKAIMSRRTNGQFSRIPMKLPPFTDCQGQYRPDFTPGTQAREKAGTGAIKTAPKCTRTHTEQGGCPVPYPQYQRIF